jgi:hypothetical protein
MSIGPNSAKTPPYSGPSASSANYSRRRGDTSTQSFIELDDRVGNREEDSIDRRTRGSMISLSGSEVLVHERFVPYGKDQGYSHEFRIGPGSSRGESVNGEGKSGGIFVTTTLGQSDERSGR